MQQRHLATRILARERALRGTEEHCGCASAIRKLLDAMAALVGWAACMALLRRTLHVTKADHPQLATIVLDEPFDYARLDRHQSAEASVALLANTLDLFSLFIGEALTLARVEQAWPGVTREAAE